jgi:hypothetical protein
MAVMMKPLSFRIALPVLLAALALPAPAQKIQRWVDQKGVVHFSDTPPSPNEQPASSPVTQVTPAVAPLTAAQKAQAEQNMRQYQQALASQPPASAASGAAPAPAGPALPQDNSCASQWAGFNASYACMNPYRLAGGGVRPEGYAKCPQVQQPDCAAP